MTDALHRNLSQDSSQEEVIWPDTVDSNLCRAFRDTMNGLLGSCALFCEPSGTCTSGSLPSVQFDAEGWLGTQLPSGQLRKQEPLLQQLAGSQVKLTMEELFDNDARASLLVCGQPLQVATAVMR